MLTIFFGMLANVLGLLKLDIPGIEGAITDLREVAILISIVFVPHWLCFIGIAALSLITSPEDGPLITSFAMQLAAMLFALVIYRKGIVRIKKYFTQWLAWILLVIGTYLFALLPVMVIGYIIEGMLHVDRLLTSYITILNAVQFELYGTAITVAFFYVSWNMRNQLKKNNIELTIAKEQAEQSDAIKTVFLRNISHEVRTPMTAINASVSILLEAGTDKQKIMEVRSMLEENSNYLLRLLDQILEFSRVESGSITLNTKDLTLGTVIERLEPEIIQYRKLHGRGKVEFFQEIQDELRESIIHTDQVVLEMILLNLLENAYKFTESGRVTLSISTQEGGILSFRVSDTGKGIPGELHEKVFERFYQENPFTTGVGLGLSLSRKMAVLLGGTLHIEPAKEPGTTVCLCVPVK